jgi:hypothetical protein
MIRPAIVPTGIVRSSELNTFVPEPGKNDWNNGIDRSSSYHAKKGHGEDKPELLVDEEFENLLRLEISISYAKIVDP